MNHRLSPLALGLLLNGSVVAGGVESPSAWLGHRVDVTQTAFCRANGCKLEREFTPMGLPDGVGYAYRLPDGWTLETYVQPDGWISNVFLLKDRVRLGTPLTPRERRLAAEFLKLATGRHFTPEAVARCITAGLSAQKRNPDVYGPNFSLSHWATPAGLPYKARCGVAGAGPLGVWAGWMQQ